MIIRQDLTPGLRFCRMIFQILTVYAVDAGGTPVTEPYFHTFFVAG
jgi:hypothetical protein